MEKNGFTPDPALSQRNRAWAVRLHGMIEKDVKIWDTAASSWLGKIKVVEADGFVTLTMTSYDLLIHVENVMAVHDDTE